jgi:hypothetical protein
MDGGIPAVFPLFVAATVIAATTVWFPFVVLVVGWWFLDSTAVGGWCRWLFLPSGLTHV